MSSVLFIDRTDYAGCDARRESRVIPYTEARRRLAEILRRVRSDIEVVVVRDRTLRFRVVHSYFLTNTVGPMRFERTISIEGSPSVRRPLPPLGNGPLRPDTEVRPVSSPLPICLAGAGMLGHTWVVTRYGSAPGEHNTESMLGQCNYGSEAVRMLDETMRALKAHGGEFYHRAGHQRSKWRRVSRAAALLDQAPDRPYEPALEVAP